MRMIKLNKWIVGKKGTSLVEVLVAAGIIVTVFAGLLQVFIYSTVMAEMTGNITLGVNEAQSKIEEIRGHDFDTIVADYGSGGTPGNTFNLAILTGTGHVTVTTLNASLLQVLVTVNWTERNGRAMTTSLATNVAKRS